MELDGKFKSVIPGWIILFVVIISGCLIYWFPAFSLVFLAVLLASLVTVIFYSFRFGFWQITISRVILGGLFIFSGFVKGIDPVGFQYRIEDYFIAFGTDWARQYALILSIALCATEFILGVLLLFNVCNRITSWLVVVMMVFFTGLTLNDAIANPVPDCGCFGDVIKMTNWQTFYKNIVIDSLLLVVFLSRTRIRGWFKPVTEWVISLLALSAFLWFEVYNFRHLPVIDVSDWKVGKNMINPDPEPVKLYLVYRNKATGEEKEYLSPNYPFRDSLWMSQWNFVHQRIDDPNPRLHNLIIQDENGGDVTSVFIENPGFQFILISYDLESSEPKGIEKAVSLIEESLRNNIGFLILTASLPEYTKNFVSKHNLQADYYYSDDTELKAMIRSNPGLILMKKGIILGKWHYNDFPTFQEFNDNFFLRNQ
jgi:uncharacterized membrane protein YphA (DoxX/SURF4 family)